MDKNKVNELFKKVVTLGTVNAFEYLNSCKEDSEVVEQVVRLLSDSETRTIFLEENGEMDYFFQPDVMEEELVGQTIADIKLIKLLGKGGMGEVYLGIDQKLQRKVAVKTIRGVYRPSESARERIRREALILSKLNHENICKIFNIIEIGDVDYLVLEYIDGETLDQFPYRKLAYADKLKLAKTLLSALMAAHKEDVVHRDIKPDNIIIDQQKVLKILDFGISASNNKKNSLQVSELDTATSSSQTAAGSILGTLGYMSPEQANMEEVTTASDIYSLGIIFQEIFSTQSAHSRAVSNEELFVRAKTGTTDPVKGVPADLSYLINRMKSIKPASRPTAFDAMEMIDRIIAKPKRRMKQLALLALVLVSVIGFTKYTIDLKKQTQKAETARNEALTAQKDAEVARDEAEQVVQFMGSFFTASDPYQNDGKEMTASQILADGAKRVDEELKASPEVLIRMKSIVADIYRKQGKYDLAREQYEQVLGLFDKKSISDTGLHIDILGALGQLELYAEDYHRTLEISEQAISLAESHHLTAHPAYLTLKFNQAAAFEELGKHQQALDAFNELLSLYLKDEEKYRLDLVTAYNYIGLIRANAGDFNLGKDALESALIYLDDDNDEDMEYKSVLQANLATVYADLQQYDKAIKIGKDIASYREKTLGKSHPYTAISYDQISRSYRALSDYEKAKTYNAMALEIYHSNDIKNLDYATVLGNQANILAHDSQQFPEAEQLIKKAITIITEILETNQSRFVADQMVGLGEIYMMQEKYNLAMDTFEQAIDIYEALNRPVKRHVVTAWLNIADIHSILNEQQQALETYQILLEKLEHEANKNDQLINDTAFKVKKLQQILESTSQISETVH